MRVNWFFPTAFLAVAAMIAAALTPGVATQRELREELRLVEALGYAVEGPDLDGFTDTTGVGHHVVEGGALPRVRILSTRPIEHDRNLEGAGAFVTLPPAVADLFSGRRIRISVTARAAPVQSSERFSVAYITVQQTSSGWFAFEPTEEKFTDFSFEYTPPQKSSEDGVIIGIWPDTAGGSGAVEVLAVRVELVDQA